MKVIVNSQPQDLNGTRNIAGMIDHLGLAPQGIAVAVNNTVIPKTTWGEFELNENDKITIIKATQGG